MNVMRNTRIKGFTIVELMAVVVIIVLITSVSIVAINRARNRTRNAIITSSLEQIQGIAETTYNPKDGYKEFYNMWEGGHRTIKEIQDRIDDMGGGLKIYLPEHGEPGDGYDKYCAQAFLYPRGKRIGMCVDSLGNKVVEDLIKLNCESTLRPANCEYEE